MVENVVVLPELFVLLEKQPARGVLREHNIGIGSVVVPEDRERTVHRDMRADRERQHLHGDIRQPPRLEEAAQLDAHHRSATHQTVEDRLVEYYPQVEWIILYEQRLSGHPDVHPPGDVRL